MTDRDTVSAGLAVLGASGWVINPGANTGAGLQRIRFTGSGTFTVPMGVYELFFTAIGCGAGGGGGHSADPGGGGGGGSCGWVCEKFPVKVVPGEVLTITFGSPSAGGAIGANANNGGGVSVTGMSLRPGGFNVRGGIGGGAGAAGVGGYGGAISSITTNTAGGAGAGAQGASAIFQFGGNSLFATAGCAGGGPSNAGGGAIPRAYLSALVPTGGSPTGTQGGGGAGGTADPYGWGGAGGAGGAAGSDATIPGTGGGGGGALAAGGAGANGQIDIEWQIAA